MKCGRVGDSAVQAILKRQKWQTIRLWLSLSEADSCLTLCSATGARVYPSLIGIQFYIPRQPDRVPPVHVLALFGFWFINTQPEIRLPLICLWLAHSLSCFPLSHFFFFFFASHFSWIPFTHLFFYRACPLSFPLLPVCSLVSCRLQQTPARFQLCVQNDNRPRQPLASLSFPSKPFQPPNLPTHAVDPINTVLRLLKFLLRLVKVQEVSVCCLDISHIIVNIGKCRFDLQ